jgi:hypothetical protein
MRRVRLAHAAMLAAWLLVGCSGSGSDGDEVNDNSRDQAPEGCKPGEARCVEAKGIWGARSGYIDMKAGESLSFECEFDNPSDQTVRLAELGKDQMCNVFGLYYPTDGNQWRCNCVGALCL